MSKTLTEQEIEMYENFISKKSPSDIKELYIPGSGMREGNEAYKEIKKSTEPEMILFYSTGMGFASYSVYKSRNNKFYIIYTYANVPQIYYNL